VDSLSEMLQKDCRIIAKAKEEENMTPVNDPGWYYLKCHCECDCPVESGPVMGPDAFICEYCVRRQCQEDETT